MALEKVHNLEQPRAVVGPVFRSNHERIFGKRGIPEEGDVTVEVRPTPTYNCPPMCSVCHHLHHRNQPCHE